MSEDCEHGVSTEDFCPDCAHHRAIEWVGYEMAICAYEIVPWPCDYELARRKRESVSRDRAT